MSNILALFRAKRFNMHREINREGLLNFGTFSPLGMSAGGFYLSMTQDGLTALVKQIVEQGTNLVEIDAHDVRLQSKVLTAPEDIRAALPDAGWSSNGSLIVKKRR